MCICRKEDYLAVKILIRNKLKKKIERGTEPFRGAVLEFGSFACFGWLFFTTGAGKVLNVRFIKLSNNECIKHFYINLCII